MGRVLGKGEECMQGLEVGVVGYIGGKVEKVLYAWNNACEE